MQLEGCVYLTYLKVFHNEQCFNKNYFWSLCL